MTGIDEVEHAKLAEQVEAIERLLADGGHDHASPLLGEFVKNAKSRMAEIKGEEQRVETEEKDRRLTGAVAIVLLVEREHRLSATEKQQYGEFLTMDYFTKALFDDLDIFYGDAWDRLSEEGKAQMSLRVWEGIRQGEYEFHELPENVRKKESERFYEQLADTSKVTGSLVNVPEQDRQDFIRAYEAGDQEKVAEVLSRESFALHTTHTTAEESLRDPSVSSKKEGESQKRPGSSEKEANDASEELSTAGVIFEEVDEVKQPVVGVKSVEISAQRG